MPPDSPLWHEVVAEAGLEAVWPLDSEDSARQLQKAWQRVADEVGESGFQVSQAAGVIASSWPDPAGHAAVDAVTAYTAFEPSLVVSYAAQACFKIIDDATRAAGTTLVTRAADDQIKLRKGAIDLVRQAGNVLSLAGQFNWAQNTATLAAATTLKTNVDIETGKPADQAIVPARAPPELWIPWTRTVPRISRPPWTEAPRGSWTPTTGWATRSAPRWKRSRSCAEHVATPAEALPMAHSTEDGRLG